MTGPRPDAPSARRSPAWARTPTIDLIVRRGRLPAWPTSPSNDTPSLVVGELHHPTVARQSERPSWLVMICLPYDGVKSLPARRVYLKPHYLPRNKGYWRIRKEGRK